MGLRSWMGKQISDWLVQDSPASGSPLCDFDRLSYEIRPGDVILIEGRSRVSEVIKIITQSPWSHAALYVGRLHNIADPARREAILQHCDARPDEQLIIEAILGKGTIVSTLRQYREDHARICRPRGLTPKHAQQVSNYAIDSLGAGYDVRQLLDLARFLFPYGILPRRWRSSLFDHNAGMPTHTVCSTMLAQAFMSVYFPILPVIAHEEGGKTKIYQRNPRRFTPRDFDYSPYFDIIKYPYINLESGTIYEQLPWHDDGVVCNAPGDCFIPNGYIPAEINKQHTPASLADIAAKTRHSLRLMKHRIRALRQQTGESLP
ncbi:YiiX/YebB-like N1pC/P60 family cysteine hydrolase [Sulfuriflexus mobilis]|uniref:YiiX/YebB-like N1pC/P60 family cysteine hydrolase n=1 Tax=Sulfuriflexus mobilis TaxID=1811807 RepID=UPI000F81B3C7|nr:YiiX/YebB-like N1pC/P60 family cysteine hydrolase [Sulfuriflexus mobilis]